MITTTVVSSATISPTEQVTSEKLNLLGAPTVKVAGTADASQITDGAINADKLADDAVTNVKVDAAAAISLSKLEAVTSLNVVAGNLAGAAASHEVAGDVALTRAVSLVVSGIAPGALAVGDELQVGSTVLRGKVVKLGAETGSPLKQTAHLNVTYGDTTGLLAVAHNVYKQSTTLVVKHASSATRTFSLGSTLAGASASGRVLTCSAGVLGTIAPDIGAYLYTVTMDTVSGVFTESESLTVDGVASSLTVQAASGRSTVGATLVTAGVTEFSLDTSVLAASVDDTSTATFVTASGVRAAAGDTIGKVLTSTGEYTAPTWQTPTVSTPSVRGGAKPAIPANFIGGNSSSYVGTVHASAWDMQGWQLSGSDYFVYLYNANFNTATINTSNGAVASTGDIAVNDIITFFPKTTSPGVQPFDTEQSVATEATGVASAYAAYKVASVTVRASIGSMTNVREVKLVRASDDVPVTWNTTTYAGTIGSTTVKALCGRQAFSLNGGRLFKCGEVADTGLLRTDPPTTGGTYTGGGSYVLLFNTEMVANTYSAHINASGEYIVTSTLGGVSATAYYGGWVTIPYRTTRRLHFNYIPRSTYSYEPREVSILIYEQ